MLAKDRICSLPLLLSICCFQFPLLESTNEVSVFTRDRVDEKIPLHRNGRKGIYSWFLELSLTVM